MFLQNVGICLQVYEVLPPSGSTWAETIQLFYLIPFASCLLWIRFFSDKSSNPVQVITCTWYSTSAALTVLSGDIYLACLHTVSYLLCMFHFRTNALFHFQMLLPPSNMYSGLCCLSVFMYVTPDLTLVNSLALGATIHAGALVLPQVICDWMSPVCFVHIYRFWGCHRDKRITVLQ
jgi:hypothetical protein